MRHILAFFAQQMLEQTFFNIINIRRTLADIRVLDLRKMRCDITKRARNGIFGRIDFAIDKIGDFFSQALVAKKTQVNGENILDIALFASAPAQIRANLIP